MVKHKYIHSLLQNNFKFVTFAPNIWIPHRPTVVPFLLVHSCHKNKIRTNKPEIQ